MSARFVSRPEPQEVEAVRWWPEGDPRHVPIEGVEGVRFGTPFVHRGRFAGTLGVDLLQPGDWLVADSEGRRWKCAPGEFDRNYEPLEEGP